MNIFYEDRYPIIESERFKSSVMTDDLERFLNLGFSHHIIILTEEKNILWAKFTSTKVLLKSRSL